MMGGREAVLDSAHRSLTEGDPQFAAELCSLLIRIDREDRDARLAKARAFRELGYAAKNISWRGFYLTGARVLDGSLDLDPLYRVMGMVAADPQALRRMPPHALVELLPLRLKAEEAYEVEERIALRFTDVGEDWTIEVRRGVAVVEQVSPDALDSGSAAGLLARASGPREALGVLAAGTLAAQDALTTAGIEIEGSREGLVRFLDRFELLYQRFPDYFVR